MSQAPHGFKASVEYYGNPSKNGRLDPEWYAQNIVKMSLPPGWVMYLAWEPQTKIKAFSIHRKCKDSLYQILVDIWNHIRIEYKESNPGRSTEHYDNACRAEIHRLGLDLWGGTFNFRPIRGSKRLSTHAFGISIDIDPEHNQLGSSQGRMPIWVVAIFERHGWTWGGRFKGRKDFQHFQRASGW